MSRREELRQHMVRPERGGNPPAGAFERARARQLARLAEPAGRQPAAAVITGAAPPESPAPLARTRRSTTRREGTPPVLEVQGIAKRFGGLQALSEVSFRLHEGEIVGLIGPNGSGKTTTFNCISGVFAPDGGDIIFGGRSLLPLGRYERARLGIGRTFQQLQLCPSLSVGENLSFAAEAQHREGGLVADALFLPGRFSAARRREQVAEETAGWLGLEEMLTRPAGSVPIGTGRLAELGRAAAARPPLLLLDEPSSGLDPNETRAFGRLLVGAVEGAEQPLSVLLVEHDMSLVMPICDYLYVLDFGRLIAEGTPAEVRRDPRVRAAYLGSHAGLEDEQAALEEEEQAALEGQDGAAREGRL